MDLCSKIIHSCQVCLKNKGISSLYAMKRCSAGECTNGKYHIGGLVKNSGPYRICFHLKVLPYFLGLLEGQNFNDLHKLVHGPIEREMNKCGSPRKVQSY